MIKLPINVSSSNVKSPKECLTQASDKRDELAKSETALSSHRKTHSAHRAGAAVRTGKDQETREAGLVHSEPSKNI